LQRVKHVVAQVAIGAGVKQEMGQGWNWCDFGAWTFRTGIAQG
jgi:hypothetical protein